MKKSFTTLKSLFFVPFSLVRKSSLFLILCSFCLLIAGPVLAQKIVYVTARGEGLKNGTSWANAADGYKLDGLINVAQANTQIWMKKGIYGPSQVLDFNDDEVDLDDFDQTKAIFLKNDVALYGGFAGNETKLSQRDIINNRTILTGIQLGQGWEFQNPDPDIQSLGSHYANHVVISVNNNSTAVLDGFTIERGRALGAGSLTLSGNIQILDKAGAGIYNYASSPTLRNLIFTENKADIGGAIYNGKGVGANGTPSSPKVTNCIFYNNTADKGSAIYNDNSSGIFTNCTISSNKTTFNVNGGSAILSGPSGGINIVNSIIYDNEDSEIATEAGGTATVKYSLVEGGYSGNTNIDGNPFFKDALGADFSLKLNSPALNKGNNADIPAGVDTDIAGRTRIINSTVDMGAYENFSITGAAGIIYVKSGIVTGNFSGSSWTNATPELADAMEVAKNNMGIKEIRVAAGTYKPAYNPVDGAVNIAGRDVAFLMRSGLAVYGGFEGKAGVSARDIVVNKTILSGNIGEAVVDDNAYHVVVSVGNAASAILDGFTIEEGNANGNGNVTISAKDVSKTGGAGIYIKDSSPTLDNITFNANSAKTEGGAVFNSNSSPAILKNTFTGNTAARGGAIYNVANSSPKITTGTFNDNTASTMGGGAIYNDSSSPVIASSTFDGNKATSAGGGAIYNKASSSPKITGSKFNGNTGTAGGAIYNDSSSPDIATSTFEVNKATSAGGGAIYNINSSSPKSTSNTFKNNTATGLGGGAIYNAELSSPDIAKNTFEGNEAINAGGGAIYNMTNSSPKITSCKFNGNKATAIGGGAIYNDGTSSPEIINSLFEGNIAANFPGGAVYNTANSALKITSSTFYGNTAQTGGAIANGDDASLSITNSILYSDNGGEISNTGSVTITVSYCLVQGGAITDTNVIDGDPLFNDPAIGDFTLKAGSPAINAGSNPAAAGNLTDLAGKPRIQANKIDLGAYESGNGGPAATVKGILYVTQGGAGDMSGNTWKNAVNGLGDALEEAKVNPAITEIWVAKGVYYPNKIPVQGSLDGRERTFLLRYDLALYGGFAGFEKKLVERNIGNNPTILSGNFGEDNNDDNNAYHVVVSIGCTSSTILDGFVIEGGNANGLLSATIQSVAIARNSGGGMYNRNSSPLLRNVIFRMNKTSNLGGGLVNSFSSSPTIINTVFYKNSANVQGGAIYNAAGCSPAISNSTFNANSAQTGAGAIFNTNSSAITNSILYGNVSNGAASNITGPATITYSLVNDNPLFENAAEGDLRLQPLSPAINAGNSLSVPLDITTDVAGNQRIYGTAVDMGAYESASYGAEKPNTPITNILSPNGDGINDFLVIQDADQYKNQLIIWNRAGQVIYSQTDYKNNWDGTINGTPVIEDAYFFAIVFSGPNIDKKFTGSVTILRN